MKLLPEKELLEPEAETSQKKADSARLDSIKLLLDSTRLDMYFQKVLLDSTRLASSRVESNRRVLDSYNKFLKSYFI
jgi:hypothetical protein